MQIITAYHYSYIMQEDRGSIPGFATWIFRDWLSPASKSRYGWNTPEATKILNTTNQPILRLIQQKQQENEHSLKCLPSYLAEIDGQSGEDRQLALARGLLAGNVFDWGAREVAAIMETQEFGFKEAKDRLQSWFNSSSKLEN